MGAVRLLNEQRIDSGVAFDPKVFAALHFRLDGV
jgi:hypothetical protein